MRVATGFGQVQGLSWDAARRALWALLAASVVLAILFAVRVPFGDNPDETAHRDYIRLILQERGFVRFVPRDQLPADALSHDETHQPPLYYLLAVPVAAASGDNLIALRLLNVLFQLATILVVFRACRDLFPERPEVALGAAAFVTFLPLQAQLAASINNDPLTTLICAAVFWRLGLLVRNGQDVRDALILGALFGTGLLTKLSVLQLGPVILVAYALAVRARLLPFGRAASLCILALALGGLIALPWFIRNTLLYGDPLAASIYRLTGPNFTPAMVQEGAGWTTADYARSVGLRSFATFWYFLHPMLPWNPLRVFVGPAGALVTVILIALGGLYGLHRWRGGVVTPSAEERRVALLFLLGVLLLVPFFAQFVFIVFQAQGRYFLPILLPAATLATLGWQTLIAPEGGRGRAVTGVVLLSVVLLILTLLQWAGNGFLGGGPPAR